jgi:hypothetical protein
VYDETSKSAKSSDPEVFVDRLSVSKEQVYAFCLHWHHRRIVINATIVASGVAPHRHHNWTITGIGRINPYMPSYRFASKEEFIEAVALALNAMKVMPWASFKGETPVISVQLSPDLETALPN